MSELTDQQIVRLYHRVYSRIQRVFAGGTMFGIDRVTLRLAAPRWYNTWVVIAEGKSRGL